MPATPTPISLPERLRAVAASAGCVGFGICTADPFDDVRRSLEERKHAGHHAGMHFTFADPGRSTDVGTHFPWAQRLVVLAWTYLPEAGGPGPGQPNTGRIARFATEDHYRGLRDALAGVAGELRSAGYRAETLCDDNRLVDRAAAVRAGVGWWGKNTMVLAPGHGPWLLLGSVTTDATLATSAPMERTCGTCVACLPACPTGALVAPGVLDARRCLAAVAQAPGVIPAPLRTAMGDRIYGCDDCLDACPPGRRALEIAARRRGRVDLVELLAESDEALLTEYDRFYIPRNDARYLRRNALVALGNSGDESALGALAAHVVHPDWLLRLHAAWALGRIGGERACAIVRRALDAEVHPEVVAELGAALVCCGGDGVAEVAPG